MKEQTLNDMGAILPEYFTDSAKMTRDDRRFWGKVFLQTLRYLLLRADAAEAPQEDGIVFRVWSPFADAVYVAGDFSDWKKVALNSEGNGYWMNRVQEAKVGDEYQFVIENDGQMLYRIDPYARAVTNSAGNAIVTKDDFDWGGDDYRSPAHNETVIYELHVGSFNADSKDAINPLDSVIQKLDYLQELGVTHIEIMPLAEFAGDVSWGYNPANIFAVEESYGGAEWLKTLIRSAHARDIGVILDVVYNHFGPSDLDLWRFDGWHENDGGGIYFYNDWRSRTPWGDTRPDYGRAEVRKYIRDNVLFWFNEYRVDGLRWDATSYIRNVDSNQNELADGWRMMRDINQEVDALFPNALIIAEDMQNEPAVTEKAGAGFDTQWDAKFVHTVRETLLSDHDSERNMYAIAEAITHQYGHDVFNRVIFTESHDEVANGKARIVEEIGSDQRTKAFRYAKRRSALGAAITLTAPGIPMLFMGQEFLEDEWFEDTRPLDWQRAKQFSGIVSLYRDLIALRRNCDGNTAGLQGQNVSIIHLNNNNKMIAYARSMEEAGENSTVVILNFANQIWPEYRIGVPAAGGWHVRFNSDSPLYDDDFDGVTDKSVETTEHKYDGQPFSLTLAIGAYAAVILSQ